MTIWQLEFDISKKIHFDEIISALSKTFQIKESNRKSVNRGFYDSFDWRIYAKGMMLEIETDGEQLRLVYRALDSPLPYNRPEIGSVPRFASDIPDRAFSKTLRSVLGPRVLLNQVEVESRRRILNILNKDEKTVLRILLEENWVVDREQNRLRPLRNTFRLQPIRGYTKHLRLAMAFLGETKGLRWTEEILMLQALSSLGRQPMDYSSKFNVQLEPNMRADAAMRIVLRDLLVNLKANEPGARENLDPEFLHDFRVAMRRTRSLLGQVKGVLPESMTKRIISQLGALGRTTGVARDLDVYIEKFDSYRSCLPESMRSDLNPLLDFLQTKQKNAYDDFRNTLESNEYRQFKEGWSDYLDKSFAEKPSDPNALLPISSVAGKAIWRAYKRVLKQGRLIDDKKAAEHLHDLRKSAKKLRYLLEFFQSLYSKKEINRFVKALKALQENLGDFQDLAVQEKKLKAFGDEMLANGQGRARTLLAMGGLVKEIERRGHIARENFADCFQTFDTSERYRQFEVTVGKHQKS